MADRKMIYLDDAINAFDCSIGGVPVDSVKYVSEYADKMMSRINALPPAQPEIIRCRECKHYDGRPCGIVDWYNTADDFCSRAERRTG